MSATDDFSPVVEEQEFVTETGLLGRRRRRHDLEPLGAGYTRILLDDRGVPLHTGEQPSAGQRYWSRAGRSWVKVDLRPHILEYQIQFSDPTGRAGFIATVTVNSSVKDAEEVAKEGATSVKDILVPALREAIERASDKGHSVDKDDPVSALGTMRIHASKAAKGLVGDVKGIPSWLVAKVTAVSVDFDAATDSHRNELIKRSRDGQLIVAAGNNEKIEKTTAMEIRGIVRDSLTPHLANPATRAIEVVAGDPSPENINALVSTLNGIEGDQQRATIALLQELIDKDYLDKEDPIYKAIVDVAARVIRGDSFTEARSSLGAGATAKEITAEASTEEVDASDEVADSDS